MNLNKFICGWFQQLVNQIMASCKLPALFFTFFVIYARQQLNSPKSDLIPLFLSRTVVFCRSVCMLLFLLVAVL